MKKGRIIGKDRSGQSSRQCQLVCRTFYD